MHGVSQVEWPFRQHTKVIDGLDALFAATPETLDMLRLQAPTKRAQLIGNLFRAEDFWGSRGSSVIENYSRDGPVVFLGTLTPNKTVPLRSLLRSMKSIRQDLIVVGGGPDLGELMSLAEVYGVLGKVNFVGSKTDPRPYMESASVVISGGRGAIESLSAGRPTIVATSDGLHGLVRQQDLHDLEMHNFTGRTSQSVTSTSEQMLAEVNAGSFLAPSERAAIASQMRSVGSIDPILRAIDRC